MLTELHIENFAIIDRVDLQFKPGLVVFTGETGAGKSILIDALETLLGARADASLVRSGVERAQVEGVFRLEPALRSEVHAILEREELLDDPETLSLGREIKANGRHVARINGRSVSASLLKEISEFLVDVHGQSEHLSLLRPSAHRGLLDNFSATLQENNGAAAHLAYRQSFHKLQAVRRELAELRQVEREAARRTDLLAYQIKEIEAAHLRPGEEETLREERNRLANAEGLASLTQQALAALDEGTPESPAVSDLFGQVLHALGGLARLDSSQADLNDQAQAAADSLADLAHTLRNYLETIEFNPRRLDQVEERLGVIQTLKRKYGDSISAVLDFAAETRQQLEQIAHASDRILELENEETSLLTALGKQGQAISETRQQASSRLGRLLEAELEDLQMSGTRFEVDFQQREDAQGAIMTDGRRLAFDANGLERVEFLIAPNIGEGLKPLARIASGGETSRLMLALKNVLARADQVPTLVFDEIDQGIGGRVGGVVGYKLHKLSGQHQVLCITHLPQLAAYGSQHFHVQKAQQSGRTITQVKSLTGQERQYELAQMLGEVSEGTMRSAQEMLLAVQQRLSNGKSPK